MTKQEENWELMTILHIPWHEAEKIDNESDRKFLLTKCEQVKEMMKRQQALMEEQQKQSGIVTPESPIVTP
jgi:hypothetical protein